MNQRGEQCKGVSPSRYSRSCCTAPLVRNSKVDTPRPSPSPKTSNSLPIECALLRSLQTSRSSRMPSVSASLPPEALPNCCCTRRCALVAMACFRVAPGDLSSDMAAMGAGSIGEDPLLSPLSLSLPLPCNPTGSGLTGGTALCVHNHNRVVLSGNSS